MGTLREEMRAMKAEVFAQMAALARIEAKIAEGKADTIRWMFIFWAVCRLRETPGDELVSPTPADSTRNACSMFVAKFVEIAALFIATSYVLLVILRFVRGTGRPNGKSGRPSPDDAGSTFATIIGPVLLLVALYIAVTRLLR